MNRFVLQGVVGHGAILALIAVLASACSSSNQTGGQGTGGGAGQAGSGGSVGVAGSGGATAGSGATAGVTGTGGVAGSGGATGAGGATAGSGGATAGSGGATGTGGSTTITVQPRALIIDPPTNRFQTFDVDGQPVRIFNSDLDFGAGFSGQVVWANGLGTGWDGTFQTGIASPRTWGLDGPAPSVILIRAAGAGMVRIKALEPSGTVITTQTLAGAWGAFELSPGRGYLAAQVTTNSTLQSAVFRVSNSQMVWQGSAGLAGFSRDDRRFVYFTPGSPYKLPFVVDLQTGAQTASTSALIPMPAITSFQLLAVLDQRAVISAGWQNYGMLLWTVDWQGRIAPFKSDMPMGVSETLQAFDPSGTKAVWSRAGNGTGTAPADPGPFEIDLGTNASTAWSGPDFSCFGRPGQIAFRITGNAVQSCNCGDGTCREIAALPVLAREWVPRLRVSVDRRTVVVTYEWMSAMAPTNPPEILCLRASGEVITRVPWGMADVDETGQMLLVHGPLGPMASQIGIVNLATGTATWIDRALRAMIVYE